MCQWQGTSLYEIWRGIPAKFNYIYIASASVTISVSENPETEPRTSNSGKQKLSKTQKGRKALAGSGPYGWTTGKGGKEKAHTLYMKIHLSINSDKCIINNSFPLNESLKALNHFC